MAYIANCRCCSETNRLLDDGSCDDDDDDDKNNNDNEDFRFVASCSIGIGFVELAAAVVVKLVDTSFRLVVGLIDD